MNEQEQLLIEHKVGIKDSIAPWLAYHYFDSKDSLIDDGNASFIYFLWDQQVDKDSLTHVFSFIIDGYLNAADRFSKLKFQKDVCNLSLTELETLRSSMPFNFELALDQYSLIRPPPPEVKI